MKTIHRKCVRCDSLVTNPRIQPVTIQHECSDIFLLITTFFPLCQMFQSCHCQSEFCCCMGVLCLCRRTCCRCHSSAFCRSGAWGWQGCLLRLLSSDSRSTCLTNVHVLLPLRRVPFWSFCKTVPPFDFLLGDTSRLKRLSIPTVFQISLENVFILFSSFPYL